jgi:hypothetical protein
MSEQWGFLGTMQIMAHGDKNVKMNVRELGCEIAISGPAYSLTVVFRDYDKFCGSALKLC